MASALPKSTIPRRPGRAGAPQGDSAGMYPLPKDLRLVAGADCSFNRFRHDLLGGLVVCDAQEDFRLVDPCRCEDGGGFPVPSGPTGIPGGARAGGGLRKAEDHTRGDPGGRPRDGSSAALWLGVPPWRALDVPTVGCAKSFSMRDLQRAGESQGQLVPLMDDDERIGAVLRTRAGVAPVFVSAGHRCDLESALAPRPPLLPQYRIPEPIRLAHELVNEARRRDGGGGGVMG